MATSAPEEIKAYGFKEAKTVGEVLSYKTKPMSKHDADLLVTYNGVCHTDLHMIDNDWGMARFPLIPGHEIVGHILQVGEEMKDKFQPGDVVALGCICQSCFDCHYCKDGYDNLCAGRRFTYFGDTEDETGTHPHHGGFGAYIRTDARKLYKVPAGLEEKYVGPLMCAGITTFEPIHHYLGGTDGKGKTIGVSGIGGLGHMALQIAHHTGAKVVAFSRGTGKTEFAKSLGADSLVDTTSEDAMKAAAGTIDQLIITNTGSKIDIMKYVGLMKPNGNIHVCGVPEDSMIEVDLKALVFGRMSISGNPVGGWKDTQLMLQFCADKGIKPIVEEFPHTEAAAAIQKVRDGSIRFRAVLKNDLA